MSRQTVAGAASVAAKAAVVPISARRLILKLSGLLILGSPSFPPLPGGPHLCAARYAKGAISSTHASVTFRPSAKIAFEHRTAKL